mgnify:CR=1 FL=1|tara:strand:+ start:480 stop:1820 length:1341 start_codon:yes stop_codon:yes gene_type:complete
MASNIQPSTFQIKIKEDHIVKGIKTLNETFYTIGNITNVDRRIVTVPPTTSIDLINVNGVNPGAGTFPSSSLKYVRITNLDTTSNLAVTFSSSKAPDGIGIVGTNITSSLISGGKNGAIGFYTAVATTASGADPTITGSGMTLDITISGSLKAGEDLVPNPNITNCGIGNGWTFITPLTGGEGTGATASVTINNSDLSKPTIQLYPETTGTNAYGYLIGDVLTIPEGALGVGQLVSGSVIPNTIIPTVTNDVEYSIPIHTTTGYAAIASVKSLGGVISTVTADYIGTGFQAGQVVTITRQELINQGYGTVSGDWTGTLGAGNVQNSSAVTLSAITAGKFESVITDATIASGGSGYEVGEQVSIPGNAIGDAQDAIFTLTLNDFTENGARSHWTMDLLPTSSIMFSGPQVTGSSFNGLFGQDIEFIKVYAISQSMDVEYVVVNSDNV